MNLSANLAAAHPARALLLARYAELQALLQAAAASAMQASEAPQDVQDFKDVAAAEIRAVVDEVAWAHAAAELAQVAAALRRIEAGTYGDCIECGDPIDERRLQALPATAFCTACQATHERPGLRR